MKKTLCLLTYCFLYSLSTTAQTKIPISDVSKHIGETVTICDRVFGGRFLESSKTQPTLLNVGGLYPNDKLTIMIPVENRKNFVSKPEDFYINKNVCVTGKVIDYKGKPEVVVTKPDEIKVDETRQGVNVEPK